MKKFFSAEDFASEIEIKFVSHEGQKAVDRLTFFAERAASIANAKLEREGKRVLSDQMGISKCWLQANKKQKGFLPSCGHVATHQALLINIEPLEGE